MNAVGLNQNQPATGADPNIVHKDVIELFPELDLTQTIAEFGHLSSEGLAGIIIDRMAHIPRKKQGTKRRKTNEERSEDVLSEYSSANSETAESGNLLVDKMLGQLLQTCKAELRSKRTVVDPSAWTGVKTLMIEHFPMVRADFVAKMLRCFEGAVVPTAIACFFVENNFTDKLQKFLPSFNQSFWCKMAVPIQWRGRRLKQAYVSEQLREHFKHFNELMFQYQSQYPELLLGLKLTQQARHIPFEPSEQEQLIECLVCFERVTLRRMVCCTAPVQSPTSNGATTTKNDELFLVEVSSESVSSRVGQLQNDQREERETDSPAASHAFCRSCIRGQAQAATDEIPLADGGVGLKCMVPGCQNPILYSDIRILLKREVRKKLDERIVEENIGMASLQNLERCKLCNFAVEMEIDRTVNKVFDCLNCGAKFCRLCERRWDEDHFGISCDELDMKMKKDKRERELEKKLNEAVIRKCPRCGLAFMKDEGCNKMTCRCGMKQCYLCRKTNIDYSHFCRHLRDPKNPNWTCNVCNKKCLLFEDANKLDSVVINQIRSREEEEEQRRATDEGTSEPQGSTHNQSQLDQRPTTSRGTDMAAHRMRIEALVQRSRHLFTAANNVWRQFPDNRQQNEDALFNFYGDAVDLQPPTLFQQNVHPPPPPFVHQPQPLPLSPAQYLPIGHRHPLPLGPRTYRTPPEPMFFNQADQPPPPYPPRDQNVAQFPAQEPGIYQQQQRLFYNQPVQPHYNPTLVNRVPTVPQPSIAAAQVMMPPPAMVDVALTDAEHAIQMFYNGGVHYHQQQQAQQNGRLQ